MRRRKENFNESDRTRIRDKDWYYRYRFHNDVPYSWDEESIPKHVPETSLSCCSGTYTEEEWENLKSTVKVQRKDKNGNIIEDYSYDYFPNKKNKKKDKENDWDKMY